MLRSLTLCFLLVACAVDAPIDGADDSVVHDQPGEILHPCDQAAQDRFGDGQPWTPQEKEACFDGCETGEEQGFQQGRLACLVEDEPCPDCVATQADPAYDTGYQACFAESYGAGYSAEGCDEL